MQRIIISFLILNVLLCPFAFANDIEGRWKLSLQDNKRTLVGILEIEKDGDGWVAYLEGGRARAPSGFSPVRAPHLQTAEPLTNSAAG